MENKTNVYLVAILALLVGGMIGAIAFSTNSVETKYVDKPFLVNVPVADNTTLDIKNKLFENDDFEAEMLALAISELESNGYKDLFKAMEDDGQAIEFKGDIDRVTIKDSDVSNTDVDDQDADVELELRVYFENLSGDDVKIYVTVDYEIVDGEVEDIIYTF